MSGLSPRAQELIAQAAEVEAPLASDETRVRAALVARLAMLPPVAPVHPPPIHAALAPAAAGATTAKVVLGAVVAATMGTTAVWSATHVNRASRRARSAVERHAAPSSAPMPADVPVAPPLFVATGSPPTAHDLNGRPWVVPSTAKAQRLTLRSTPDNSKRFKNEVAEPAAVTLNPSTPDISSPPPVLTVPEPPPHASDTAPFERVEAQSTSDATVNITPASRSEAAGWTVSREVATLREIETALAEQPHRAIDLLDRYTDECPKARFMPERDALRILALCGLGRVDEARAGASRFRAVWPSSPLQPRLDASCAGAPR
jgi:hypothetical protein